MALSKDELRERWRAVDGQEKLKAVVEALKEKENWWEILVGFPGVEEVVNGRDLRGAYLPLVNLKGVDLFEAHLEGADLGEARLEGAYLMMAHLEGAQLHQAHLEGAKLFKARLEGAELWEAHLEGAELCEAHLEGAGLIHARLEDADLMGANLEGAKVMMTHLEGAKLVECNLSRARFIDVIINRNTDFRGSNIDSILCRHKTLNHIRYNIRRMNWEDWYQKHPVAKWPVRLFWWLSEYGTSEKNLFISFVLGAVAFALVYWKFPNTIEGLTVYNGQWVTVSPLLRSVYFSIVTMTTLGFGDIHAAPDSSWGHVLLTAQVLMGYLLLGALVSRLAILFQSGGPTEIFEPDSMDALEEWHQKQEVTMRRFGNRKKRPGRGDRSGG